MKKAIVAQYTLDSRLLLNDTEDNSLYIINY